MSAGVAVWDNRNMGPELEKSLAALWSADAAFAFGAERYLLAEGESTDWCAGLVAEPD